MKKPMKKPAKNMPPMAKSKGAAPATKVPGGSGKGGPESLPKGFGGGKVKGGGIAARAKGDTYA